MPGGFDMHCSSKFSFALGALGVVFLMIASSLIVVFDVRENVKECAYSTRNSQTIASGERQGEPEGAMRWYKVATHAHSDLSDGHYWIKEQAAQYINDSYDVLWITDHEMSMANWMAWHGDVKNGDFERALNDPGTEGSKAVWLTKHEGAPASVEIVQRTSAKANTGSNSIYIKEVAGTAGSSAQGIATAWQDNDDFGFSNLMWYGGMTFTFAIQPASALVAGTEARVTVYSFELVRGWEPFRIVFRASAGTIENGMPYRPDPAKPWIVYYDLNEPPAGQWTTYTINLTDVALKALGMKEMMLCEVHLSAVSSGGLPSEVYFDSVKWERIDEMSNDQKFNATKQYIETLNQTLPIRVYTGLEFSGSHHLNGFCLPKYYYSNENQEQNCVNWVHNNGGFISVNHVNGTSAGGLLHNGLQEVIDKGAWNADFVELDCVSQPTIDLWDSLLQSKYITGILGPDDHGNGDGSVSMNPSAVWVLSESDLERDLMEALQNGSAFIANRNYTGIATVRDANSGRLYSRTPINTSGQADLDISITNLTPGSTVKINCNGDYTQSYPVTSDRFAGTYSFDVPKAKTYFRVEVWDDKGNFLLSTNPIYFNPGSTARPAPPLLSVPANGTAYDKPAAPTFEWAGSAQSYYFLLAEDEGFSKPIMQRSVNTTSYTPQFFLPGGKTYYWRVSAFDGTQYSAPSAVFMLTVAPSAEPTVELLLPQNGASVSTGAVSFTWTSTPNTANYAYHLYLDTSSATTEVYSGTASTYAVASPLAKGTYYWKVKLVEGRNAYSSPIFSFTVASSTGRAIQLLFPPNGTNVESKTVRFAWTGTELDGMKFELFIGQSADAMNLAWSGNSMNASATLELEDNVTYYWKVTATPIAGGTSITSALSSFTYGKVAAPVASLRAPLNGATICGGYVELLYSATDIDTPQSGLSYKVYLDSSGATTLVYDGKDKKCTVQVENGKNYFWRVKVTDGKKSFMTGIWNFSTSADAPSNALPSITLTSPDDGAIINADNVTLKWQASDEGGNALKFKLYLDPSEGSALVAETEDATYQMYSLAYGTYYWKVLALDSLGGIYSELRHFSVTAYNASSPPTVPTIIEPLNGDVFVGNEVDFSAVSEDPNGDAITYVFQFSPYVSFVSPRTESSTTGTVRLSFDSGTYYWRVKASDGAHESSWSRVQLFVVDAYTTGLGVTLLNPANGSKITTLSTHLTWSVNTRANALYKVYLSADQAMVQSCAQSACIRESTYQLDISSGFLKSGKRYYWTVIPIANRAGGVCRSGVFYFDTDIPNSQFQVSLSSKNIAIGQDVTITATILQDVMPGGDVEYYFDFGDGANSGWIPNSSVTHKYGTSGAHKVKVKARSSDGGVWMETGEYNADVSISGGICGTLAWSGTIATLVTMFAAAVAEAYGNRKAAERQKSGPAKVVKKRIVRKIRGVRRVRK